jgi:dTDP-4-amino-4,6-dideoxygalactose transaminase
LTDEEQSFSIPMSEPDITDAERAQVASVLQTPHLSNGPKTAEFERLFASYVGTSHAVAVSSGTSGLHMSVIAAGVESGDLVVTTPFSFVASSNVILYERGIPIFVDVEEETGNIDPDLLQEAVADLRTGGKAKRRWLPPALRDDPTEGSLRAIIPVHVFGHPCETAVLREVASDGIALIEDACEALGARTQTDTVGRVGESAVFAFYPNKQMTTGEGGMVVTDNEEWAQIFRSLRNQGRDVFDAWLNHSRLGFNYRLDEMSSALGIAQIQRVDELLQKRQQVATWYSEALAEVPGVEIPRVKSSVERMSWFVYVIRLTDQGTRSRVIESLDAQGIPTRPYFTPIHLQPFYMKMFGYSPGDFPVTESLADRSLALPFSGRMDRSQVDRVVEQLTALVGG